MSVSALSNQEAIDRVGQHNGDANHYGYQVADQDQVGEHEDGNGYQVAESNYSLLPEIDPANQTLALGSHYAYQVEPDNVDSQYDQVQGEPPQANAADSHYAYQVQPDRDGVGSQYDQVAQGEPERNALGSHYAYQVQEGQPRNALDSHYAYQVQEGKANSNVAQLHWGYQAEDEKASISSVPLRAADNLAPRQPPPPPEASVNHLIRPRVRQWAKELATLREIVNMPERRRRLVSWHDALVATAVGHAASIIAALHDPAKLANMTAGMGGIAGGTKFIFDGLVFKLATDPLIRGTYLYGAGKFPNLERAAKAASQELKGANALFECLYEQKLDITVPMQVMIDYCGERLVAMPLLPIKGSETLIYGSCDAGHTVLTDPLVHQHLRGVCGRLHLAEHQVTSDSGPVKLWLAGDVEGHRGHDGRLYLLDLARTFPPEDPRLVNHLPPCTSAIWFRLIRPEFLRLLKQEGMHPLSSDSFSKWGSPDMSHNQHARTATEYLIQHQVPKLAWHLASFLNSASLGAGSSLAQSFSGPFPIKYAETLLKAPITGDNLFSGLCAHLQLKKYVPDWAVNTIFYPPNFIDRVDLSKEFHDYGVPMRYLGLVHDAVFSPELKLVLIRESVARSLKNLIRADLRASGAPGSTRTSHQVLIHWFNLIVRGPHKGSITAVPDEQVSAAELWNRILPVDVEARFGSTLLRGVRSLATTMQGHVYRIINYLLQTIGINLSVSGKVKMLQLCSKGHKLTLGVIGRVSELTCDVCQMTIPNSRAHSCIICDFDCCTDCFGIPPQVIEYNSTDIEGFYPRVKSMSFISAIQVQCLADQAVELASAVLRPEKERREEFLSIMQQVKDICERLLRTDPTCVSIIEQLRFATHAVELLSAVSISERHSYSDNLLRSFYAEVASNRGEISDGLKMMIAAGALGDRMLVIKATKYQNLAPIRCIVEAGGYIGNALGISIGLGNRPAVAYFLEILRRRHNIEAKISEFEGHYLRKTMTSPANVICHQHKNFHYCCRSCDYSLCDRPPTSVSSDAPPPRFHYAFDPHIHHHPLARNQEYGVRSTTHVCKTCKKSTKLAWICDQCIEGWCLECVEPENDSHVPNFISPLDTSTIDDAMLKTIAFGLQNNHAISYLELVGCPFSARATAHFFSHVSFSPSLTSLDFSANTFDREAMNLFATAIPLMSLRQLTLAGIPKLSNFLKPLCLGLLNARIEDLDLSFNQNFGDAFMQELREASTAASLLPTTLRKLTLASTSITTSGLADFIALGWNVQELNVSRNKIDNDGIMLLMQANNLSLRVLDVQGHVITPTLYERLSDALVANSTLDKFRFSSAVLQLDVTRAPPTHAKAIYKQSVCKKGHSLERGANGQIYQTPETAVCDVCRRKSDARESWSCVLCGYDVCPHCVSVDLFVKYYDMGRIFDARQFHSEALELMVIAKHCQLLGYTHLVIKQYHTLPLSSVLQSTAIDFRDREFPGGIDFIISDTLHTVSVKFSNASPDALVERLIDHPVLTDLELGDVPVSDTLLKLIRHGSRLKRLKLKWEKVPNNNISLLQSLSCLVPTLSALELTGLSFTDFSDLASYTSQNTEHPFHCFTGASILKLKHCRLETKCAALLFQAIAHNTSLQVFCFTRARDSGSFSREHGAEFAGAVVSIFSSCPKLSVVWFEKLPYDTLGPFYDTFHSLAWPALANNSSLTFLKLKPVSRQGWDAYAEALRKRENAIEVDWSEDFSSVPTPDVSKYLPPKLSGLNMYRALMPPQSLKDILEGLLPTTSQPRGPLHSLALGSATSGKESLEGCALLCGKVLADSVLQVQDLCLHDTKLDADWVTALKGSHSLTRLDLSGRGTPLNVSFVVEIVAALPSLMALNIGKRICEKLTAALIAMIDGCPTLRELHAAGCSPLPCADFKPILEAALSKKSNLMYVNLTNTPPDQSVELILQEMLWRSAKPLLFLPIPISDKGRFLHWIRMDRLVAPQFPRWRMCHGPRY